MLKAGSAPFAKQTQQVETADGIPIIATPQTKLDPFFAMTATPA